MKNVFKLIEVIALVAVIGFGVAACGDGGGGSSKSNGDSGKDDKTGGNGDPGTNVQNANVYNLDDTPFNGSGEVFLGLMCEDNNDVVVKKVGNITNGKLSFTLPDMSADVAKGFLAAEVLYGNGIITSSPDARMLVTDETDALYVKLDNGEEGVLGYIYIDNNSVQFMLYAYLDKSTKKTGTSSSNGETLTVNCTFTKGWNVFYWKDDRNGVITISTNPSNFNVTKMKWYYGSDADWHGQP